MAHREDERDDGEMLTEECEIWRRNRSTIVSLSDELEEDYIANVVRAGTNIAGRQRDVLWKMFTLYQKFNEYNKETPIVTGPMDALDCVVVFRHSTSRNNPYINMEKLRDYVSQKILGSGGGARVMSLSILPFSCQDSIANDASTEIYKWLHHFIETTKVKRIHTFDKRSFNLMSCSNGEQTMAYLEPPPLRKRVKPFSGEKATSPEQEPIGYPTPRSVGLPTSPGLKTRKHVSVYKFFHPYQIEKESSPHKAEAMRSVNEYLAQGIQRRNTRNVVNPFKEMMKSHQ